MRVKLCQKYQNEREEMCFKILDILGLKEEVDGKRFFLLSELDSNIVKQEALLGMREEIQKYFACSTISSFKPNFPCKRPYLNLVRGILKQQGYTIESDDLWEKKGDGLFGRTMKYSILRNI